MKKMILLLAGIYLCSCSKPKTNQQKAEFLVKLYLDSTLNDPKSYENIKFEKIDTVFTTYKDDLRWNELANEKDSIDNAFFEWKKKNPDYDDDSLLSPKRVKYFTDAIKDHYNKILSITKAQNKIQAEYKPKINNWSIDDRFRAKNSFGALGINDVKFEIDSSLSKVVTSKNL